MEIAVEVGWSVISIFHASVFFKYFSVDTKLYSLLVCDIYMLKSLYATFDYLCAGKFMILMQALEEEYGPEDITQQGVQLFQTTVAKLFDLLQTAYGGQWFLWPCGFTSGLLLMLRRANISVHLRSPVARQFMIQ